MESIEVCVRLKPPREGSWITKDDTLSIDGKAWSFDKVFVESDTNVTVHENCSSRLVHNFLRGINCSLFTYGQTASGKTHTMYGNEADPGIVIRCVLDLLQQIDSECTLRLSFMELYNENIKDLLDSSRLNLKVHENYLGDVFVEGLSTHLVDCAADFLSLLRRGSESKKTGKTQMNLASSRSHTILRLCLERITECGSLHSSFNFIDLAGSESAKCTNAEGMRLREGAHINKSLLALTNVISRLAEKNASVFIPYRDSKLTRILQSTLSGNSATTIVCTLATNYVEESQVTLGFALRAKTIVTRPVVNEVHYDVEIAKYKTEISRLRQKIEEIKADNVNKDDHAMRNIGELILDVEKIVRTRLNPYSQRLLEASERLREIAETLSKKHGVATFVREYNLLKEELKNERRLFRLKKNVLEDEIEFLRNKNWVLN